MIAMRGWTQGLAVAALAIAALGCGSSEEAAESATERMIESAAQLQGQDVEVDLGGDGVSYNIKTAEGTVAMNAGDNVSLPADMPEDVPVIAGFQANMVQSLGEQGAFNMMGTVAQPPAEVSAWYAQELATQGWEEVMRFSDAGGSANLAYKKENRALSVAVIPDDAGSLITLTHAKE